MEQTALKNGNRYQNGSIGSIPLNKIPGTEWWDLFFQEPIIPKSLFVPPPGHVKSDEAKRIFKRFVCIINIETSTYCNRKCNYCPNSIYDRSSINNRMDDSVFNKIMNSLSDINFSSTISFNLYNEPLADDDIFRRIENTRNKLPQAFLKFNSNGDYIQEDTLDTLVNAGNNAVFITLHPGAGKPYDDEDRLAHFRRFFKRINRDMTIDTIEPGNYIESDIMYKNMRLKIMANNWGTYGNSRANALEYLKTSKIRNSPCVRPFREFTIYYDGQVYPCCQFFPDSDSKNIYQVGTIQSAKNIFDLYVSKTLSIFRRNLFGFNAKMEPCATCADLDYSKESTCDLRKDILRETIHNDSDYSLYLAHKYRPDHEDLQMD